MKKSKIVDIQKYLENKDIEFVGPNRRGFINIDCVFCGGNKKLNIYIDDIDYTKGFSNCWVCQKKCDFNEIRGEIEGVDPKVFEKHDFKKDNIDKIKIVSHSAPETNKTSIVQLIKKIPHVEMPTLSRLIKEEDTEAISYLNSRGVSLEDAIKLGVYVVDEKKYRELRESSKDKEKVRSIGLFYKRIIFPVHIGQGNFGYVARDYSGKRPSEYKVLNSKGNLTSSFFWNFNSVRNSSNLVIVEGIFDAIKCGIDRSIALLGKTLTNDSLKIKLIQLLSPDTITLYPDNGAYKEMTKMALEISKVLNCEIKVVISLPVLNNDLTKEQYELLDSLGKIKKTEDRVMLSPWFLKIYKDASKAITKDNLEMVKKLPKYKDKNALRVLLNAYERFKEDGVEHEFIRELDYKDAGDRSLEENSKLIESAQVFNPFYKYHFYF